MTALCHDRAERHGRDLLRDCFTLLGGVVGARLIPEERGIQQDNHTVDRDRRRLLAETSISLSGDDHVPEHVLIERLKLNDLGQKRAFMLGRLSRLTCSQILDDNSVIW